MNRSNTIVHTVTAANKNYLRYLACHLSSLARLKVGYRMAITVIHKDIDRSVQKELKNLVPAPHQLNWFEPNKEALKTIQAPLEFAELSPHYYRLLIPFILSAASRALYLDADTMVLRDFLPLWFLDLEESTAAAVRDYIPHISKAIANWQDLNLDPHAPYFNSGVLLIDLDRWRKHFISEKVLNVCHKYPELLLAQRKWPQYDQYGLNIALYKNWKELDKRWNYGTDQPPADANVIHFIGNGKIGFPTCHPFFSELFHHVLKDVLINTSLAALM